MTRFVPNLRARALLKIAELSATRKSESNGHSGLERLSGALPEPDHASSNGVSLGRTPMGADELHVLLALCEAASRVERSQDADRLYAQLSPYLLEAPEQRIAASSTLQYVDPSPWEALSGSLTTALLSLATRHGHLYELVEDIIFRVLERYVHLTTELARVHPQHNNHGEHDIQHRSTDILVLSTSLLGFLGAISRFLHFLKPTKRLHLIKRVQDIITEDFMIAFEGTLSSLRHQGSGSRLAREQRHMTNKYARSGRPLGAMLLQQAFMTLLVSCGALQVTTPDVLQRRSVLDHLMPAAGSDVPPPTHEDVELVQMLAQIAAEAIRVLDDGEDYLELSSPWQQHLALKVRGQALTVFLTCVLIDEDVADADVLMSWLDTTISDEAQMADTDLASVVFKCLAILARTSSAFATSLSRLLPRFIVRKGIASQSVDVAARCFASVLQGLSQDAVITSLYSLGNVLTSRNAEKSVGAGNMNGSGTKNHTAYTQHPTSSAISFEAGGEEESLEIYSHVVKAIITITLLCEDREVVPLAQSMLLQKLRRVNSTVDTVILVETAALGAIGEQAELKSLLKLYDRQSEDGVARKDYTLLEAVRKAHVKLASSIPVDSPSFRLYMWHVLETIVSKGDIREKQDKHDQKKVDVELVAEQIGQLLLPLSLLAPYFARFATDSSEDSIEPLQREVWFNLAAHGILPGSTVWEKHLQELREIAIYTKPLVAEDRTDHLESDIELNTVLRRGMSGHYTAEMKKRLINLLPSQESHIRSQAYPKVIFLHAAYSVETLRAEGGACADILSYFIDPSVNQDGTSNCMVAIADKVLSVFLSTSRNELETRSTASSVSRELARVLAMCCHRISHCQSVAITFADKLIAQIPSSLCQRASLFALLELLTMMWASCLEAETDEYEWKSAYTSAQGGIRLELSDDFEYRRSVLKTFHRKAKLWIAQVISIAPLDVKGLFQTYLSEFDDDGAYGHVALGRSFAIEMGSAIPSSDQRLGAIDRFGDHGINTASDFVAQYTTRQEYKYAEALPEYDHDWEDLIRTRGHRALKGDRLTKDAHAILAVLDHRCYGGNYISTGELRDLLRRAAALICRSTTEQCALIHHVVSVPFQLFSKQSLKLGISLWLGVINENPSMESRVLVEILRNWEESVQQKQGVFSDEAPHVDPFYLKEEYAPSDRSGIAKRQHLASNIIAPHLRVLQFLSSHIDAYRLGSPHLQKSYQRMINITLDGLRSSSNHPLAREFHFHSVLFALKVLKYSGSLSYTLKWRLKDRILSAGLAWFAHIPRFTFGGNRLQLKAECQLLLDVEAALSTVSSIGSSSTNSLQSLVAKQDLLVRLITHEYSKLQVWLFPNSQDPRNVPHVTTGDKQPLLTLPDTALKVAWTESPGLALQIAQRAQSPTILKEVRWKLLNHTSDAIDEPEALHMLLESGLPTDVSFQLKYLLYWRPINPISAVTYFLPSYKNHPFVVQYAMRALESHPVDITFFYVPQIVQALRYDALGYVQRYIVETAKVSQLFAHQIIWNMKANAYKDEDSTIEDELKPRLDDVMLNMIESFSEADKDFYEREFAFFNEVTDISGKLRPYIKKEKSEKKQKIEEELRKIQVEIGVYLPSNPDGVVIGIDRKSGKPLQSHAKAPYMATFRIRKNKVEGDQPEKSLESAATGDQSSRLTHETTYDVWQSAIFKVGDDCRQDVLALQMIAAFRNIFNDVGLDVWVFPYRVTATAPGCGVIDVLPNSISRDMLGREAVNGLYDYFVSKYGGEDSIRFQEARNNFVKSMAAYSVISYLLQFKDRHNGNIMVNDAGHIIHIDFGFCFDIAPGGVRFERAPFKLTSEMVAVMGGNTNSQSYKWFEELSIKAFLASRAYVEKLSHLVILMLDSGLPCFKPETITHFKERFVLGKNEREAADFMKDLIKKSNNSYSTKGYDQFQLLTNGIPY